MRGGGTEIVGDQAYFIGSTAELQRALTAGELDRCSSLVVEGKLNVLPPEIGRLTRLRELVLDTDTLQSIDAGLFACVGLMRLIVLSNQIKALPAGGWGKLQKLERLDISTSRALRELPEDLGEASNLGGELDLTPQVKIKGVPQSVGRLGRVTLLRLPHGMNAPDPISGMAGLRELKLRGADKLPADIGALQELRLLDATECLIKELPASIGGARSLRTLLLGRTQVSRLPDSVCSLTDALRELDLEQTPLEELPEDIGALRLTRLRLQQTRISRLPDSLARAAGDLRVFLSRDRRAVLDSSSRAVLEALGNRVVYE